MKKTHSVILLIIAAILIVGGISGIVYFFLADKSPEDNENKTPSVTVHSDVEYSYDEKGNIKSEIYYKDNEFNGKKDYYRTDNCEYITVFDKDMNEIASTKIEKNIAGCATKTTEYENHKTSRIVEYDYAEDMRTVVKKTEKVYEGEDEIAEKIFYSEQGVKLRVCKYLNGELTSDTYYDEKGNIIENGGETIEE